MAPLGRAADPPAAPASPEAHHAHERRLRLHSSFLSAAGSAVPAVVQPDGPVAAGAVFVNGKNPRSPTLRGMTIYRMDHAGVVVEDLAAAIAFFVELGLELEGEAVVEGEWVDQLVGLDGVRADIAVVRTPDGHGRVELSTFHTPVATSTAPRAPMNTPGIPRLTFVVDAVDDVLDRLRAHGAELVGEVAQYGDIYRYCYVRGPDGIIIGLIEELR
jgi:catechol 2,3-dioxygenase-like lactoylglutathione lyase family enzyme